MAIKTILGLLFTVAIGMSSIAYGDSFYGNKFNPQSLNDDDKDGVINIRDLCPDTPLDAVIDNNGCPQVSTSLLSLDLKVLFDSGQYDVKPRFYSQIKRLADFLNTHPESNVVIQGYTDNTGQEEDNITLSQNRAAAIADVLVNTFRINQSRVSAKGYGEANPVASNETAEGRAKNRRVIADVTANKTQVEPRWTIYSVDQSIK